MAQFDLYAKLGINDGAPLSIPNARVGYFAPYWLSNSTGCVISKLKTMLTWGTVGEGGGTINIGIYTSPSETEIPQLLDEEYIKANWTHQTDLSYFVEETEGKFYQTEVDIEEIILSESTFIIGVIDVVGDIKMSDLFLWGEYVNNPDATQYFQYDSLGNMSYARLIKIVKETIGG